MLPNLKRTTLITASFSPTVTMVQTRSLTVPIIHYQALVQMVRLKPLSNPLGTNASGKKADELIFGKEAQKEKLRELEEEKETRRRVLAKALLEAARQRANDEDENEDLVMKEEDQKSYRLE